jgi:hypothetical protein
MYFGVGIYFYVCLGRLAAGLGRSAINWCGETLLATSVIFCVAWRIAWLRMRDVVNGSWPKRTSSITIT